MKNLEGILFILSVFITYIGVIPAAIIGAYMETIICPVIIIILSIIFFTKKKMTDLIKYIFIFHIFCLGAYISLISSPGTDDSLSGLDGVINSMLFSSLFAILAIITMIIFAIKILVKIIKSEENMSATNNDKTPLNINNDDVYCLYCGTYNDKNNLTCTKCGTRLK